MFRFKLGNGKKENPYIYKWEMECFGQSVELSLSRKEFADFEEKSRKLFSGPTKVKPYLESVRRTVKKKWEQKKERAHKAHTKKSEPEREA